MKRPLACVGFGVLAALAAAAAFPGVALTAAAVCLVLSAALFALRIFSFKNITEAAVFMLCAAIAMTYYAAAVQFYKEPLVSRFDGQCVTFSGVITSLPYTENGTTRFTVKTDEVNGEKQRLNLSILSSVVPSGGEYDLISGKAVLYAVSEEDIGLDFGSYCDVRRIFLGAYISTYDDSYITVTKNGSPPFGKIFADIRKSIRDVFYKNLPGEEASLCIAMLTGDKSVLDNAVAERFRTLGVVHMLVVSGMHISIAAAFLSVILDKTFKALWISIPLQFMGLLAFAAVTGFGYSVRRSLVMFAVILLSKLLKARDDQLNTLGFAALVICGNPFVGGDIGLLWSVSCTFSLILLTDRITDLITSFLPERHSENDGGKVKPRTAVVLVSAVIAAGIGSIPFTIFVTKVFSPYTLLANILIVPVAEIILLLGSICVLLCVCEASLATIPLIITGLTAKYMLFVTKTLDSLPYARIALDKGYIAVWFVASAAVLSVVYAFAKNKAYFRLSCLISAAALAAIVGVDILESGRKFTLTVPDTSGMSVVLKCGEDAVVLCAQGESGKYGEIKSVISEIGSVTYLIDIADVKEQYNYGKRIVGDYDVSAVLANDEKHRRRFYSWYEYCGGITEMMDNEYTLDLPGNAFVDIYRRDDMFCEYISIYDRSILIFQGDGDIPGEMRSPDIAILEDDSHFTELDGDTMIILSRSEEQYYDKRIAAAAVGERIDITVDSGGVALKYK